MKTITLSEFSQHDAEWLADLIDNYLQDQDIQATSFAFNIEVDYEDEEETNVPREMKLSLADKIDVTAKVGGA